MAHFGKGPFEKVHALESRDPADAGVSREPQDVK